MASKHVVVKLHNIFNDNTGEDPGNQLEVYGFFNVSRLAFNADIGEVVTLESKNLFDRSSDNPQDIVEGTAFIIDSTAQLDIFEGEFLQISGRLSEHDTLGPNDVLGIVDQRIPFRQLQSGTQIVPLPLFQDGDQRVTAKMSKTVT